MIRSNLLTAHFDVGTNGIYIVFIFDDEFDMHVIVGTRL